MRTEAAAWLLIHPPYCYLSPDGQERLVAGLEIAYFSAGDQLAAGDQPVDTVWVVRRGAVRRKQPGPDVVIEEGESIGDLEAVTGDPLSFDHEVIEDSLCYGLPPATLAQLGREEDGFRDAVLGRRRPITLDLAVTVQSIAAPAIRVEPTDTVGQASQVMDQDGVDAVLVTAPNGEPDGILTTRDLRSRVLAAGRGPDTLVSAAATPSARTIDPEASVTDAMVMMLEHDVHHLPLDRSGPATHLLSDHDILLHHGNSTFGLLRQLQDAPAAERSRFGERVAAAVTGLQRAGVEAAPTARAVTSLIDALMRNLCRDYEAEHGPPPVPYAMAASGSQGRREQTMLTDQDNFLVYDSNREAAAADATEAWFEGLAAAVIGGMIDAGIPSCKGGYMATNWRGSLRWWNGTVDGWAAHPTPEALLDFNVCADLRVVHGDLPETLLWEPFHRAATDSLLLRHAAAEVMKFRPPGRLSRLFGRDDTLEIKRHGLIPIVGMARIFGLELGLTTAGTVERLSAAADADLISDEAASWLIEGHGLLTGIRTRTQLEALAAGHAPSPSIEKSSLDPVERSAVAEVLRMIATVQQFLGDRLDLGEFR